MPAIADREDDYLYTEINTYEEIDTDRPPKDQLYNHYYRESRFWTEMSRILTNNPASWYIFLLQ